MEKKEIASLIDHTLLRPDASLNDIMILCNEAIRFHFRSVCINPYYVKIAKTKLENTDVKICTVIGFPFGSIPTSFKVSEAKNAIENGADELDVVLNIGCIKDGLFSNVSCEIKELSEITKKHNVILKVILETCLLEDCEIVTTCLCAKKAGADYVVTSTGYATPKGIDGTLLPNGAYVRHVKLMREAVGNDFGVKAFGGIRSARIAKSMIEAGASRIGSSISPVIITNW